MKIAVRFVQDGNTLYRHVGQIAVEGDLLRVHSEAFHEFRKLFPQISLFEGNLMIGYEKG